MEEKLFIPGPVEVNKDILNEMARPMISHRGKEFSKLYSEVTSKIQEYFKTENLVILSTSSATGLMEGGIRNLTNKKCLNTMCGAFSDKWHDITIENGKRGEKLKVEWGKPILAKDVREKLESDKFDALTLVHNETSTGLTNPIEEISKVMKKNDEVNFIVDTVSSAGGIKIEPDKLGIDFMLFGVQKCFSLPPGLSIAIVSEKAIDKAKTVSGRGHYFDILSYKKSNELNQTPSTPSISHLYALNAQLDRMLEEGDKRFTRHERMAKMMQEWARENNELFPEKGYESVTVSCIKNTRGISTNNLIEEMKKRGKIIVNGYGELKDITFRIGHMGELTDQDIKKLIEDMNDILQLGERK